MAGRRKASFVKRALTSEVRIYLPELGEGTIA
jgi:hypothetical protein